MTGYSQEGSVSPSRKTRSSEQFLSLESRRKVQRFKINKITPSLPISFLLSHSRRIGIYAWYNTSSSLPPLALQMPHCRRSCWIRSPLFFSPPPFQVKLGFITRYHNTSIFTTSSPSGRHCNFSFNPHFLHRNRTEAAIRISSFNQAIETTTGF